VNSSFFSGRPAASFEAEVGLVVFTSDGGALFGWRDLSTGLFHSEADGRTIVDAIGAVEFVSDPAH
jgi:hypothetical protein